MLFVGLKTMVMLRCSGKLPSLTCKTWTNVKILFLYSFFLILLRLSDQDTYHNALNNQLQTNFNLPSVTQWVLPDTEAATLSGAANYGTAVSNITATGQPFSQARNAGLYASPTGIPRLKEIYDDFWATYLVEIPYRSRMWCWTGTNL